jgi:hypothetical protein
MPFMDQRNLKLLIFVLSFIIAGFIDNFINERTFQRLTSKELQTFPLSGYFIFYQIIFIAAGCLIIYGLRKEIIDLLLVPIWLVGFDVASLLFDRKSIFWQANWRKEIWGNQIGFIGEPLFGIPIAYWISFVFLVIYLVIAYNPQILNKKIEILKQFLAEINVLLR